MQTLGKAQKSAAKRLMHADKRGQLGMMSALLIGGGVTIVVAVLLLAFSADVIEDVDDGFTAASYAANISRDGKSGLAETAAQTPNIGKLLGVSVILGLVLGVAALAG